MTIFSFPRPFINTDKGKFKTIQENAITSWKLTHPDTEIILFGDEEGTHEICNRLKLKHFPKIKINCYGTPYLNDLFEQAQRVATSDVLCYLHSDIILIKNLDFMITEIKKQFSEFLLLGRRWDLFSKWNGTVKESTGYSLGRIEFNLNWKQLIEIKISSHGRLRHPGSCDCYIFTKGLYPKGDLLPFLLGRQLWDGWIIHNALERKIATVDISSFKILHQTHTRHKWGLLPTQQCEEELEVNRKLSQGKKGRVNETLYFWKHGKLHKR